ncbi:MAG: glycoside hydrolase [Betaproteobacteria bacterium]|nr:glycoside hydrolase [Betaproteobacteria bacterium]
MSKSSKSRNATKTSNASKSGSAVKPVKARATAKRTPSTTASRSQPDKRASHSKIASSATRPRAAAKATARSNTSAPARHVSVLVGTRKGAFIFRSDGKRRDWAVSGPHFLGHIVQHVVADPRDGKTLLCAARAGHLGPTVFRSSDFGRTWKEATQPPAFAQAAPGEVAESVAHTFWLTPGHASEPGVWYAGTSPPALFRSEDGGATWQGVDGFNRHAQRHAWIGTGQDSPPDGSTLHSINVAPDDARHLIFGVSSGGVFESHDRGATWVPMNAGCEADFLPDPDNATFGHDPHCLRVHPQDATRMVQQNHCGIYLLDAAACRWQRVGRNMPKRVGDIGFPMVLHPRDRDRFWVFPMDGSSVWPRTSPGGKPAVYGTRSAGRTWQRLDAGLPAAQAWWTVKRQAMSADACASVGLYFGTTSGELWASTDEGARWRCIAAHLPHIYSVETLTR